MTNKETNTYTGRKGLSSSSNNLRLFPLRGIDAMPLHDTEKTSNTPDPISISIAMATFNGASFLEEQLASILRQTLPPMELVVTDDGSSDSTIEILERFAKDAPFRVCIIRNHTRLGYAENFLKATSLCEGMVIAFSDQDDIWMDNKLETCVHHFEDPGVVLAMHSATILGSDESYYLRFPRTQVWEPGSFSPFVSTGSDVQTRPGFAMIVRRDLLMSADSSRRPQKLHGHDHWTWFLAASSGKIATIADSLASYRHHGNNVFGRPKQITLGHKLRLSAAAPFSDVADNEQIAAEILSSAADNSPEPRASTMRSSARKLVHQANMRKMRSQIYAANAGIISRAFAFSKILVSGGYRSRGSDEGLGMQSGVKDMLIGVPGLHKLLSD